MRSLSERLRALNDNGVDYAHIGRVANLHRTTVSKLANNPDKKTTLQTEIAIETAIQKIKDAISEI